MLYFLSLTLWAIDKALEKPAARKRLEKRERELGLKEEDNLFINDELGIALPERDAQGINQELIRKLGNGRGFYKDLREAGMLS